jgi:trimethylamine--corrinoid protein Co-methyltransferase
MADSHSIYSIAVDRPYDLLDAAALDTVHDRTLEVLDTVGVTVRSDRILGALADVGATVDRASGRVRFDPALVDAAISRAPRSYVLAARGPGQDLETGARRGYLALDGCAAEIVDLETGNRRPSTVSDVAEITRLADALPEIGFVWQPVAARDVPASVAPLHELSAQFANTTKHIQLMTAVTPATAASAVEMARIVAGGADALRARPLVSSFQCSVSPLHYPGDALEAALVFAAAGIPAGFVAMPISAATAPATAAGTIVQANAEILAGIAILELLAPGAPTFYGICPTVMDLRSGAAACGGPEDVVFQLVGAQLARRYRLPSSIGTFATGAKTPDWQAGAEGALSVVASWLGGADMLCGAGLVHAARVHSSVEMLLDVELFGLVRHLAGGVSIGDDEFAIGTIADVGPGGTYLSERHTVDHMRNLWMPRFIDRQSWESWDAGGRPGPADRARDRVRRILATHQPEPLDAGIAAELDRVIASAGRGV